MENPRTQIQESVIKFINRVAENREATPAELEAMAALVAVVWGQSWYSMPSGNLVTPS
jgi:hypothetical protein